METKFDFSKVLDQSTPSKTYLAIRKRAIARGSACGASLAPLFPSRRRRCRPLDRNGGGRRPHPRRDPRGPIPTIHPSDRRSPFRPFLFFFPPFRAERRRPRPIPAERSGRRGLTDPPSTTRSGSRVRHRVDRVVVVVVHRHRARRSRSKRSIFFSTSVRTK